MNDARKRRLNRQKLSPNRLSKIMEGEKTASVCEQVPRGWCRAFVRVRDYHDGTIKSVTVLVPNHIPEISRRSWLETVKKEGVTGIDPWTNFMTHIPYSQILEIIL